VGIIRGTRIYLLTIHAQFTNKFAILPTRDLSNPRSAMIQHMIAAVCPNEQKRRALAPTERLNGTYEVVFMKGSF